MLPEYIIPFTDPGAVLQTVGGKGASLARLSRADLPVPGGFHVTTAAYRQFVAVNQLQPVILIELEKLDITQPGSPEAVSQDIQGQFAHGQMPEGVAEAINRAYADLGENQPVVAVRSSATAEDLPNLSFAGQQETFLNIQGTQAVLEAVKRCWASLWTARAISYRHQHRIDQDSVSMGVVVQILVPAEAAGILFTANPVSGQCDQAMISAAWGLGEAIVSGQVTPDALIVDKTTGRVLTRQIADKQTMTVRVEGRTEEQPVPERLRRRPVLSDGEASELVRLGAQIEALYGMPVDIEWVRSEKKFSIVQARPITALPEPEPAPPTRWKLPEGQYAALRNNIIELMADPLTPLFDSLGRKAINVSFQRLMTLFFGDPGIMPEEFIISVNGYAYNNGSLKPAALVKVLLGSVGILKRMFTGAVERWTETGRPRYIATVESWQSRRWRKFTAKELLEAAGELSEAAFDAYGLLDSGVIPAAWITEGIFTLTYNLLIKRRNDPTAPTYLMGFDSTPIRAEKSLVDLAEWIRPREGLAAYLRDTPAAQLAALLKNDRTPPGVDPDDWYGWQSRLQSHLGQFGHMIYNLDFANPVPVDDPTPLLETCQLFINNQGADPYVRQQAAAQRRELATQAMLKRLKGLRLKVFEKFIRPAQRFAPLREDGLADVGLGYPLLRQMLLEMGRRITEGGMIAGPEDIFWLNLDEVENAATRLDDGEPLSNLSAVIPARKAAWRAVKRVTPPTMLPQMLPHLKLPRIGLKQAGSRGIEGRAGETLRGVAASPGRVTAPACVLNGPEDFGEMKAGDVLIAAITTPAWTPLFARAAAIVTDVGGPLSHGSIVAREYGIPAVLGTGSATKRIRTGQVITVDGSNGVVILGNKVGPVQ